MQITLRQMRVFLAIAKAGNLSVASQELSLSKSAVSQALMDLEDKLGVSLFERVKGRLLLSSEGRRLKPQADELMDRSHDIENLFTGRAKGQLRLDCTFTIGSFLLADMMRDFRANAGWMPSTRIANTADVSDSLLNFTTDLAIIEGPVTNPNLMTEPWIIDEMVVVAPKGHRLAEEPATWEKLSKEHWVLREEGSSTRVLFDALLGKHLEQRHIVANINSFETIVGMLINGMGITFISERILHDPFFGPHLAKVRCPEVFTRELSFCLHREKYRSTDMQNFMAFCHRWGADRLAREHERDAKRERSAELFEPKP